MTAALVRREANYQALTKAQQERFDQLMEHADEARSNTEYLPLMTALAALAGLPAGEIRKCGCSCVCPVIFDANDDNTHVIEETGGYNLGRVQCPTCADWHLETA
ncbi:hypothetical protein ACFVOR_37455 [Streptomyces sp. NPDC057837]|uniref:hypothetical protein n=1 Tax=Streptomyces sp. NPDC057837 TaxID=3346260 RepID=UPI00367E109A